MKNEPSAALLPFKPRLAHDNSYVVDLILLERLSVMFSSKTNDFVRLFSDRDREYSFSIRLTTFLFRELCSNLGFELQ